MKKNKGECRSKGLDVTQQTNKTKDGVCRVDVCLPCVALLLLSVFLFQFNVITRKFDEITDCMCPPKC
jgi:hypothetical protein